MKVYLEILNGHQEGTYAVMENKESFTIGSGDSCDLVLASCDNGTRVSVRCVPGEGAGSPGNGNGESLVVESFSGHDCFVNAHPLETGTRIDDGDVLAVQKVKIYIGINRDKADKCVMKRKALKAR